MNLSKLFIIHAIITFTAGIVLIVAPVVIPATVEISINDNQYLLCYLLAASELALAFLSFESRKIKDLRSLRLISLSFIIFHLSTALLEIYVLAQGGSVKLIGNIILRVIVSSLFFYYGRAKLAKES